MQQPRTLLYGPAFRAQAFRVQAFRTPAFRVLAFATLALALAACAASGPSPHALGNQPFRPLDGYLNEAEQSADCKGLKSAMTTHASEIRRLDGEMTKELEKPAPTIARMMARSNGTPGRGTVAYEAIERERKAMLTINAKLEGKSCPTVDIDQAIASAAAPATTMPKPACPPDRQKPGGACTTRKS